MKDDLTSGRVAFIMRSLLAIGVVLSIVVVVCKALNVEIETEWKQKRLDVDIAEGVRLYNPKAGVDSVRIGFCRIEKMRSGPIAFGGLNVLIVGDLELNLPLSRGNSHMGFTEKASRSQGKGRALAGKLGLSDEVLALSGVKGRKFSGIRISGLRVNRIRDRSVEPLFTARSCRNHGRKLVLDECEVHSEGVTNRVGEAFLLMEPAPHLQWDGGSLPLDDLLPD